MDKLKLAYPVIVEGKYDRIRLDSIVETAVLTTDGFRIFKDSEKAALLRKLAEQTPVLVLTDSDKAGAVIRGHIAGMIPPERLIHVYVPQIEGKEKRKDRPSAEGYLGVEGISADRLRSILEPYAAREGAKVRPAVEARQLMEMGLTGRPESARKRDKVACALGLPSGMTARAFIRAVQWLADPEELAQLSAESAD